MIKKLVLTSILSLTIVLTQTELALAASGYSSQTTSIPTQRRISEVKELPTTGIPMLAWALVGLIPMGKKMIGYGSDTASQNSVLGIKEAREFKM